MTATQEAGEIAETSENGQEDLVSTSRGKAAAIGERSRAEIEFASILSISLAASPFTPFSETVICARVLTKQVGSFVKSFEQFLGRVAVTALMCGRIQSGPVKRSAFGGLFRVC